MIMKWMGWGWKQYLEAPADLVDEIVVMIQEEQDRIDAMQEGRD